MAQDKVTTVNDLYEEMVENGILFFDYKQPDSLATTICIDGTYGVFFDSSALDTTAKEKTVVAHECGHCFTGTTHAVNSPYDIIERHEYRADKWATYRLLPFQELLAALYEGCCEAWQLAERFNITETFVRRALDIYKNEDFHCVFL